MRKMSIIIALLSIFLFITACAVPDEGTPGSIPSPQALLSYATENTQSLETIELSTPPELETFSLEERTTKFTVLTAEEKEEQIRLRSHDALNPLPIVEWKRIAQSCPYTIEEILNQVALGDRIEDVYSRIGYPTYRDSYDEPVNRGYNFRFMSYRTADNGVVWIIPYLAGYSENDYRYIIAHIVVHENMSGDNADSYAMTYDEMVSSEIIPVFVAVEQKGVDYLLENDLITPYEATLYAAEEAVFQSRTEIAVQNPETDAAE